MKMLGNIKYYIITLRIYPGKYQIIILITFCGLIILWSLENLNFRLVFLFKKILFQKHCLKNKLNFSLCVCKYS